MKTQTSAIVLIVSGSFVAARFSSASEKRLADNGPAHDAIQYAAMNPAISLSDSNIPSKKSTGDMSYDAMADDKFWKIIESIPENILDPYDRLEQLRSALNELTLEELIGFEITFRDKLNKAYSWDLWGAAYVIHSGCSDDGFEYFRRWLVSRGRETYEKALENPDTLATINLTPTGPEGYWEFEEIYYVAMEVFAAKGGEGDVRDRAAFEAGMDGSEPAGSPFEEDIEHLSKRYPGLWQKFSNSPLPH